MLKNLNETASFIERIAILVGTKTLVMWCVFTTFTTGYLFIDGRQTQEARITEIKQSNERLLEEVKGIKQIQKYQTDIIDSTSDKVDTTISKINMKLNKIRINVHN